ncbi:MAG: methylated-DNA--[protein]-cysteine S-methyltransferase [Bacteroidetes bacterium]|nr:methylated-DNA--[protein]-cysteine S-methyltransferase [Bacteroidota bacterium]
MIVTTHIETDLGTMIAAASDKGICMLNFADCKHSALKLRKLSETFKTPLEQGSSPYFDTLRTQLQQYFKGERKCFDIPLDLIGTEFQKQVWNILPEIPYGKTISYAEQAALLGKPAAVRAVASANGKNKIGIILPCHRVIGANGALTGYDGGIERKKKLLELESAI